MLVKVMGGLYIASREDLETVVRQNEMRQGKDKYALCFASKTYHKMVAKLDGSEEIGYKGNMPKDSKEYLIAHRPNSHMIAVNLIDAPDVKYISPVIINACLDFIHNNISSGRPTIVFCDQGKSRSATIVFMYLLKHGFFNELAKFENLETQYRNVFYPYYEAGNGMREYAKQFHEELKRSKHNG